MTNASFAQDCPGNCEYNIPKEITVDCDYEECQILEVSSSCTINNFEFTLYNKWAEIVFQSTDPLMKFDTGGEDGNYMWVLKGQFCNGTLIDETGIVTIQ